ncbi:MAG: hypothetical protein ABSB74_18860 [Tepidisphaeraceae bacterium]
MELASSSSPASQSILVLGMHRSSTSVLSRILNLMGMNLGSNLLPPAADNESGFWEHRDIQHIHDRIYESFERDWTYVTPQPQRWWEDPRIEPWREQLRQVIVRDFSLCPLWGIKDPRLCDMLPLWRALLSALNCQTKCVLIFRNPADVGRSLAKRDGLSLSRAYLLWLGSIIAAERDSRGLPRTITTYEMLLANWKGQIERIGRDLCIQWPISAEAAEPAIAQFIHPSFRHHHVDNQQFLDDPQTPESVRSAYAAVLQAAASGRVDDLSQTFDRIADELDRSNPLLTRFVSDFESEHRATVIARNLEAISFQNRMVAHDRDHEVNLAHAKQQLSEVTRQLAAARQELIALKLAVQDFDQAWNVSGATAHLSNR